MKNTDAKLFNHKILPVSHYLSKDDLCRHFHISRTTLNRWIRFNKIPPPTNWGSVTIGWSPEEIKNMIR